MTKRKERTGIDRSGILRWLDKCIKSTPGEEIFIPCDNARHRRLLLSQYNEELRIMSNLEPEHASAVFIKESYKDKRFWLVLERKNPMPHVAYKKNLDGNLERQELEFLSFERRRLLDMMIKDGLDLELIKKLVPEITKSEINYVKRKRGTK